MDKVTFVYTEKLYGTHPKSVSWMQFEMEGPNQEFSQNFILVPIGSLKYFTRTTCINIFFYLLCIYEGKSISKLQMDIELK
jgi:hypothetical protein